MRQEIDTGLPSLGQRFSWAVADGKMVHTSHGPVMPERRILQGDITAQNRLTLENPRRTIEAAGGSLDEVLQVRLYLLDLADMKPVDAVYAEVFRAPTRAVRPQWWRHWWRLGCASSCWQRRVSRRARLEAVTMPAASTGVPCLGPGAA
jgi:enamine deaminase RidA (YjgF/YER057c/UK114 family)